MTTTLSDRKTQLLERLAFLTRRLEQIESELSETPSKDWEELAIEREDDEVLEGIGLSGNQEIRMIEAALKRIEAGEYGECVKCGAEISQERLDVLPYTPFCHACAV